VLENVLFGNIAVCGLDFEVINHAVNHQTAIANKTAESRLRHLCGKTVNLNLFTHFQSPVNYQKTSFVNKLQIPTLQTKLPDLYALKQFYVMGNEPVQKESRVPNLEQLIVNQKMSFFS